MISPFPPRSFQGWRHFGSRTRSTENRHSNRIQGIYFSAKQQLRHPLALFSNLGTRPHFGVWKICGQEARGAGVRAARGRGGRLLLDRRPKARVSPDQKVRRAHSPRKIRQDLSVALAGHHAPVDRTEGGRPSRSRSLEGVAGTSPHPRYRWRDLGGGRCRGLGARVPGTRAAPDGRDAAG